ncbi:Crp/Fnr family transcriptional regulator [Larkinella bovis]|uniref:Crp/Fnr family transcriptional regulator n=1 Tax=Larkinella bovis TaxID=683041 RepID=A0ABW0I7Q3_9BACT
MIAAKKKLFDQLSSIRSLSTEVLQELEVRIVFQRLPKGAHLLQAGETGDRLYYIARGLVRGYCVEEAKEITTWLAVEGEFAFSGSSFLREKRSNESIELLEYTELFYITRQDLHYLHKHFPKINYISQCILQQHFLLQEERLYLLRQMKAEKRLEQFRQQFPDLWKRVQNQHIASYLGINPATLSRLLRKK